MVPLGGEDMRVQEGGDAQVEGEGVQAQQMVLVWCIFGAFGAVYVTLFVCQLHLVHLVRYL